MRRNLFCAVASPVFVVAIKMASNVVCGDDRDIPYCDVFSGDRPLNNDEKLGLLTAKWDNVHEHTFPSR